MTATYSHKAHRLGIAAFFFILGFCFASWASRIPYIQQQLFLSETQLGFMLLALPAGSLLSLPLAGLSVAKYNSKIVAACSLFSYPFILIAIGLAQNKVQLAAALFCFGLAGNTGNISINTQAVSIEALYKRNILASFHGVWSLAGFCGAGIGTFMSGFFVVPVYHFMIAAVISTCIFFVAYRYLLSNDIRQKENAPLFAMPDKSLLILGLIAFCCMLCEGTMFDWSGVYFKKIIKPSPSLVGAGYTAFMCTMALSRFAADRFTNKYGFRVIIRASGLIIMSGLLLAVLLPYFYTAVAGFLLVGVGVSSIVPLVYSAAGRSKKLSAGIALASVSSISFFGFLAGPPVVGFLAGIFDLRLSFALMAFMGLCITLLGGLVKNES